MAPPELLTALRLLPLAATTSSLWFAVDQHLFFSILLARDNQAHSAPLIPSYFRTVFSRGFPRVLGLIGLTVVSTFASLRSADASVLVERGSYGWYVAGAALSVGHMLFVPWIKPSIDALHADPKEKSVRVLGEWLRVHDYRTLVAEFGAWICCAVATVKTFTA
ncbi:hypothetical protein AAE478_002528 [Parahypoxylon ruwenzoriense]